MFVKLGFSLQMKFMTDKLLSIYYNILANYITRVLKSEAHITLY